MKPAAVALGVGAAVVAVLAFLFWPRKASASTGEVGAPPPAGTSAASSFFDQVAAGITGAIGQVASIPAQIVNPDAFGVGEDGPTWAKRMGTKYHGKSVGSVPATTRAAMIEWMKQVSAAVHSSGAPAYNQPGVPCLFALPPPASQWAPPGFYWIVRRKAAEYDADLARAVEYWNHDDYPVIFTDIRCQRDWGVFGSGLTLSTLLGTAGALVGSIFGPAGTAAGAAVGGVVGKVA